VSDSSRSAAPITLFTGQWADLTLEEVATLAQDFGYDGLEIACSAQHLDVRRAAEDPVYLRGQLETLERHELNVKRSATTPSTFVTRRSWEAGYGVMGTRRESGGARLRR